MPSRTSRLSGQRLATSHRRDRPREDCGRTPRGPASRPDLRPSRRQWRRFSPTPARTYGDDSAAGASPTAAPFSPSPMWFTARARSISGRGQPPLQQSPRWIGTTQSMSPALRLLGRGEFSGGGGSRTAFALTSRRGCSGKAEPVEADHTASGAGPVGRLIRCGCGTSLIATTPLLRSGCSSQPWNGLVTARPSIFHSCQRWDPCQEVS
jgi:hypothetical protein